MIYRNIFFALLGVQVLLLSCSNDSRPKPNQSGLELVNSVTINVFEPSGLAINSSENILYVVSDNTAKVYGLSIEGDLIQTFSYVGNDLEGVSTFTGNKLLLAEERSKEIVEFDMITGNFSKHSINYTNNDENSGIEGVTFKENDGTTFILNEKNPGKLIRLRADFSIIVEYELTFANDYSGLFYDQILNVLWIVSDQNKTLNKCTLNGELIKKYSIPVSKAEGVVVTNENIYIVSDSENKLYNFRKPEN